jgi:hypothetical protein
MHRVLLGLLLAGVIGSADTLVLRGGKTVEGTYLGGDARKVRWAAGDAVQSYDVSEVTRIEFGAAKTAPAAPAPTARRQPILRPDPPASSSAAPPATVEIPAGSSVVIRMIDDVDSERDKVGQTFRAALDEPIMVDGRAVVDRGADVTVKLVDDKQSGRLAGRTELTMDVESIVVNGRKVDLLTQEVTQASASRTGRTAKVVGGTAAVGAIIGAIAGGGRGAAIGAASGAGAGTAVQVLTKGQRIRIPSETRLTFTLEQPVRI